MVRRSGGARCGHAAEDRHHRRGRAAHRAVEVGHPIADRARVAADISSRRGQARAARRAGRAWAARGRGGRGRARAAHDRPAPRPPGAPGRADRRAQGRERVAHARPRDRARATRAGRAEAVSRPIPGLHSAAMAGLKCAYLISGDDDAKIDAWRARVRRRAEEENGPGGLETFTAPADPPEAVAIALTTLTSATGGDRYLLADNVESWKAGELEPLERELAAIPEGTVLVLIARGKPPAQRLAKAIEKAGGELREYSAPKPWQMPKWAAERAREEGLNLDQEAAKALVAAVGPRQQRLAREVEMLAILAH